MPAERTAIDHPPTCASAPLLWILLPLSLGIILSKQALAWGLPLLIVFLILPAFFTERHHRRKFRAGLLIGFVQGILSWHHPHPMWSDLPPREVRMQIKINELFNARIPGRLSGTGRILGTDIPHDTVRGNPSAFYLETNPIEPIPLAGDIISCAGILTYIPALDQPDDYQMYLKGRDIFLTLNRGKITNQIHTAPLHEQKRAMLVARYQAILQTRCENENANGHVLASMMLGNRSLLNDERIELYRQTGTYHLFAVSGLHVGGVALCLHLMGSLLGLKNVRLLIPVLFGTWIYVWITGASPSAMRAGIMISCIAIGKYLLRQPHLFPALVLSALVVLVLDPGQLFDLGFQLSYGVVASIILNGIPLAAYFRRFTLLRIQEIPRKQAWKRRILKVVNAVIDLSCISFSAGMASMPLIVEHFNLFIPGGILLGVFLNPLATFVIMTGCVVMLIGTLLPDLAGWIAIAAWPAIHLMELMLEACIAIPGSVAERSWRITGSGTAIVLMMIAVAWVLQRIRQQNPGLHPITLIIPNALVMGSLMMINLSA